MPAPDSSSPAPAPLSSIGRSIGWSLRREQNQIHSFPPPPDDATDAFQFQRRATDLLTDRLVADFFDRAIKALDLCNAVRDGLDLVRQWRKHLAIAAAVLSSSSARQAAYRQRSLEVGGAVAN